MKKLLSLFLALCVLSTALSAGSKPDTAGSATKQAMVVHVAVPIGAPGMAISKLAVEKPVFVDSVTTEYEIVKNPSLMQARIISGEADIAIVPTNLAAVLYAKKMPVQLAGSVVWGILYGVTTENISSVEDLKGKTVLTLGRGLTPDITVREIVSAAGLTPDEDVRFEYVQASSELAPAFISGKASIAIVPEPMLSMVLTKKPNAKIFLDVQKEWRDRIGGNESYPQASLIVSTKLMEENPAYVKAFLKEFAQAVEWTNAHPQKTAEYATTLSKGMPPAPIIAKAMPRMNIKWKPAAEARPALEAYYKILEKANPKFIGGALPGDNFYYQEAK